MSQAVTPNLCQVNERITTSADGAGAADEVASIRVYCVSLPCLEDKDLDVLQRQGIAHELRGETDSGGDRQQILIAANPGLC